MANYLDCVIVEQNPTNKPINNAVIWLHGLGANGHDFEPIIPDLNLSDDIAVRFIFPNAPERPVTINGGAVMPAWYDILEMSLDRKVDVAQIQQSAQQINDLIDREIARGVPSENIVIAGFSQGGAVAYHVALNSDKKLAGLLALSTYLATNDHINYNPINLDMPIAIQHGNADPVVPAILSEQARNTLESKGYQIDYRTYNMGHQVCLPQIHDIGDWLDDLLAR